MDIFTEFDRNAYFKKYRDANRTHLNAYMRDYRKTHPKPKKECECGASVSENTIHIHRKTAKHQILMESQASQISENKR